MSLLDKFCDWLEEKLNSKKTTDGPATIFPSFVITIPLPIAKYCSLLSNDETKIAYSTCVTAKNLNADAIVCYTHSGNSARTLAGLGAGCPILAITDNRKTFNQLALAWNVTPVFVEKTENIDTTLENGIKKLQDKGYIQKIPVVVNKVERNYYKAISQGEEINAVGYCKNYSG